MSHILVQNAGELPIWGMRLLGLSNKSENQIGQFGTGLKESIALLCRMEIPPVIYSGTCRFDFKVREIDGQDEICFKNSEKRARFRVGSWHGLGMHPDFGKADWDNPWMVFREVICNALDESGTKNLHHDVVSTEPEGVEGSTRVYIPTTPEILSAYSEVHNRLLALGEREAQQQATGVGRALVKGKLDKSQIFHRGVWVQESVSPSLYDYELDDLKLNESRSCDWHLVDVQVGKMISLFSVPQAKHLILTVGKEKSVNLYEADILTTASHFMDVDLGQNWLDAWYDLFGENAVVTDNDKFFYDRLDKRGHRPIVIAHDGLRTLLKSAGVPDAARVLSEEDREYETIRNPKTEEQEVFDQVWKLMQEKGLTSTAAKPALMMFKQRPGSAYNIFGYYRENICGINEECAGSPRMKMACVEEIGHHVTGALDHSEEFQHWLVESLAKVLTLDV